MDRLRTKKRLDRHLGKIKLCHCILCRWKWVGRKQFNKLKLIMKYNDELKNETL